MASAKNSPLFAVLAFVFSAGLTGCNDDGTVFPVFQQPTSADALTFAGSDVCRTCHQAIYESWEKSRHTKKVRAADLDTIVNDADSDGLNDFVEGGAGVTFDVGLSVPGGQTAWDDLILDPTIEYPQLGWDGTNLLMRIGPNTYAVTYVLGGTGKWKQRYLITIDNQEYISPVQYNDVTREYVTYHPEHWYVDGNPADAFDYDGYMYGVGQTPVTEGNVPNSWQRRCMGCHVTGVRNLSQTADGEYGLAIADMVGAAAGPRFSELPVACEACHGPAARHVQLGGGRGTALNPADLAADRADEVCGSCHIRGASAFVDPTTAKTFGYPWADGTLIDGQYRPGDVLDDFYDPTTDPTKFWGDGAGTSKSHHQQFLDHRDTPHARAGVTCFDCHEPHGSSFEGDLKMEVSQLCLSCHDGRGDIDAADLTKHTRHNDPAVQSCHNCHFNLTAKSGIKYDVHSHTYRVIFPAESEAAPGLPNSCAECHQPQTATELTSMLAARWPDVHPVAYARTEPSPFVGFDLHGDQSFDPLGGPITYEWTFHSGPPSFAADQLLASTGEEALFVPSAPGKYTFLLVVTNRDGLRSRPAEVEVDVPAGITQLPVDLSLASYVGSATCSGCHSAVHDGWEVTRHTQKVRRPNEGFGVAFADTDNDGLNDWIEGGDPPTFSVGIAAQSLIVPPVTVPPTVLSADANNTTWDSENFSAGIQPPLIGSRIDPGTGERVYLVTLANTDAAGNVTPNLGKTYEVTFVLGGTGKWKQRYMVTLDEGEYILPIQYNEVTNEWVTYHPDHWYDFADGPPFNGKFDSGETLDGYLYNDASQTPVTLSLTANSWQRRCMGCHTTGLREVTTDPATNEYAASINAMLPPTTTGPRLSELGVACEACHGPGSIHAAGPSVRGAIINPAKLSSLRAGEACGQCHNRGASDYVDPVNGKTLGYPWGPTAVDGHYIPGTDLSDFYTPVNPVDDPKRFWEDPFGHSKSHHQQWLDYRWSEHFTKAGMSCGTCHTGHADEFSGQLDVPVTTLCTSCHQDIVTDQGAEKNHSRHGDVSEANQCTSCHLPLTAKSAIKWDVRAHSFQIIWPNASKALVAASKEAIPNSCMTGGCHSTPEGSLMAWSPGDNAANDEATAAINRLWGDIRPYAIARVIEGGGSKRTGTFTQPVTVTLDGTRSYDPNDGPIIGFNWEVLSAPGTAMLSNRLASQPTVDITVPGTYIFSLVVRDQKQSSEPATVTITAK